MARRYGRLPSEVMPSLPSHGGWTELGLNLAAWQIGESEARSHVERGGMVFPVVEV